MAPTERTAPPLLSSLALQGGAFARAAQRLMQALGAYGNILHHKGDEWYRQFIMIAAKNLRDVIVDTELETPLAPVLKAIC